MSPLADRLSDFAAALLNPVLPVPHDLVGPDGESATKRFAVYRNNVVIGLMDALQTSYPAVCRIVGEEFFRAMARAYVVSEPPASPILLDYGAGFANFIAAFEPAASLPYLPDVARIEHAWTEAYHAPEAAPLTAEILAEIPNDSVAKARFTVHPSLRVVSSRFPALTIWRMNVGDGVPGPVGCESGREAALVIRPQAEVEVHAIPLGGTEFLLALAGGKTLIDATQSAVNADPYFDLSGNIAALIGAGAFVDYAFVEDVCEVDSVIAAT